jgi:hypothetical protein
MIKNQILPEVAVYEKWQEVQNQTKTYRNRTGSYRRSNNRKTNRCRKVQTIKFVLNSWPPVLVCKHIKTFK